MKNIKNIIVIHGSFEQSGYNSEEFKDFAKTFKKEFGAELKKCGAELAKFSVGHFYLSGFYKKGEQLFYFSWHNGDEQLLYRTAKDEKDFTGGSNKYVRIEEDMTYQMGLQFA